MVNQWMETVKKVRATMPNALLKDVLKKAKVEYAKMKKTGEVVVSDDKKAKKKTAKKSRGRKKGKKGKKARKKTVKKSKGTKKRKKGKKGKK